MRTCYRVVLATTSLFATTACAVRPPTPDPRPTAFVSTDSELHNEPGSTTNTEARRATFAFHRVHSAAGQFIAEDVLAAAGDIPLIDVLDSHLRGFIRGRGVPAVGLADIGIDVYVNGLRAGDVLDVLHPRDLVGVEYYDASSAPVNYRRAFSAAPVLILWLK